VISKFEDINKDGLVSAMDLQVARRLLVASAGLRWITLASPLSLGAPAIYGTTIRSGLDASKALDSESAIDIAFASLGE